MLVSMLDPFGIWGLVATILTPWTAEDYLHAITKHDWDNNPLRFVTGC